MFPFNTFRELEALRREVDRVFSDALHPRAVHPCSLFGRSEAQYPLVNIGEDAGHVYIEALAPGVDPSTLNITVLHDQISIEGEIPETKIDAKKEAFHRQERAAGRFLRTMTLPCGINPDKVAAECRNGLLLITMDKPEEAKPRRIAIEAA